MSREKRYFHLFYGLVPLLIYFGISMVVVMVGDYFQWTTDILNFIVGLLNFIVLYGICYREYNKRGGNRAIPPLLPCPNTNQQLVTENQLNAASNQQSDEVSQETAAKYWRINPTAYVWIIVLGASSCLALNNWFSVLGLFEKISTYKKVADSIYYGSLWMVFARTAILAPLVEEVMVRGMVYRGLSCVVGRIPGMVASALIFALMHGNLLQGMYAFILGILFAYVYDMSGRNILAPILAHMSANVISVLGSSVPAVAGFFGEYFYILTGLTTILMIIALVELYTCKKRPLQQIKM